MREKDIEEKLARMKVLSNFYRPLEAQAETAKKEYAAIEAELIEYAKAERWDDTKSFDNGSIKINPGKGALAVMTDPAHSDHSFDKAALIARDRGWKRFYKPVYKLIKNRVKDEADAEVLSALGLEIVKENSITVEVF